jgi:hypothetical protein
MAQLKDCTAASRMRFAHTPPQEHGPRINPLESLDSLHSQGKTLVFPQLRQFLVLPLCCLMNFWKMKQFQQILLSKTFPKLCMFLLLLCLGTILAHSCPASCQPSCSPPPLVWVRCGGVIPPLQPLYDGPYAVLRHGPRSFTIRVGSWDEVIAISRLMAYMAADSMPGSPCRRGRPPGSRSGGPATTKRVSFADPLLSLPSFPKPPQNGPGTIFLPGKEVFARPDQWHLHSLHRHGTRPVNGYRPRG